tara:strand:+ start:1069 stop:1233 length:165 start_codon:yes stop_codon:yes gene_type:complete
MTYTIATRPSGSTLSFVPVIGYILMPLREAQALAQEYRASGEIEAVAYNTQIGA